MSSSQLALSQSSSPSRRSAPKEEIYGLAVQRTFRELGTSALEKQRMEMRLLEQQRKEEMVEIEAVLRRKAAEMENAQELKRQMAIKQARVHHLRLEELIPGITSEYSGYPNLPETPEPLRKQLKTAKQQEMKRILDLQRTSQLSALKNDIANDRLAEQERLTQALKEMQILELDRLQKRVRDREVLTKAWSDAERAKAIRIRIEEMQLKGINPRAEPITHLLKRSIGIEDALNLSRAVTSLEDAETHQKTEDEPRKKEGKVDFPIGNDEEIEPETVRKEAGSVLISEKPEIETKEDPQSMTFDARDQAVNPPVIQQYDALDISHGNRARGRLGAGQMGVVRFASRKQSKESVVQARAGNTPLGKQDWNFATLTQEGERGAANQSAGGRSQSQVVKPSVYVVRKYDHQRYHSRVLTFTGANSIQQSVRKGK